MPSADFVCNSKACATKKGAAPVYELPVKAVRCPVCGRKSLRRLFNKVNVNLGARPRERFDGRHTSSSMAVRTDALVEGPYQQAMEKQDTMKAATAANIKSWKERNTPLLQVVPSARLANTMANLVPNQPLTPMALKPGVAHKGSEIPGQVGDLPRMTTKVEAVDREHTLAPKEDGSLEIRRA